MGEGERGKFHHYLPLLAHSGQHFFDIKSVHVTHTIPASLLPSNRVHYEYALCSIIQLIRYQNFKISLIKTGLRIATETRCLLKVTFLVNRHSLKEKKTTYRVSQKKRNLFYL